VPAACARALAVHHRDAVVIDLGPKIGEYHVRFLHDLGVLQLSSPRSGGFLYVYNEEKR
jgi:hypothetical protein